MRVESAELRVQSIHSAMPAALSPGQGDERSGGGVGRVDLSDVRFHDFPYVFNHSLMMNKYILIFKAYSSYVMCL